MKAIRAAVIGIGSFGRQHVRAIKTAGEVELAAVVDIDFEKAQGLGRDYGVKAFRNTREVLGQIDAAVVATPTVTHEEVASELLEGAVDVLVEKPIAESSGTGERLAKLAQNRGRILQVGHLERFNPAITALEKALTIPLFFEIHRLSVFTRRSLDIDVVLDLMIHDLDIVLSCVREHPVEIRAAGISVLSPKVDIANARISFPSGCVANLTASRVSTEKIRKLRLFQPGEYISVDYQRQDGIRLAVNTPQPGRDTQLPRVQPIPLLVQHGEPLQLELAAFWAAVRDRSQPRVDGFQASNALRVAEAIADKIKEHTDLVTDTIRRRS